MLYVIVGPSGAGKTTFMRLALKCCRACKIVPVDVYSSGGRHYEKCLGRKSISLFQFVQNVERKVYSSTCTYLENKYGFTIPKDYDRSDISYLLDYPGDYPACLDIQDCHWKGVLILPPSVSVLKKRLLQCNRRERITSAQQEYQECLKDIKQKQLNASWTVIINDDISIFQKAICDLLTQTAVIPEFFGEIH